MINSKTHILETAFDLFQQKGFKEVTMKTIVEATGLSKGAFYHYFSSKEQVFAEVIDHFFLAAMQVDHSQFAQDSLKQFYTDWLDHYEKGRVETAKLVGNKKATGNYYYLIFDALRLLPDFKKRHAAQQKAELSAWKKIVATARKNGEIKTPLADEQIAKLFIYLGDGIHLNGIVHDKINKGGNELKNGWDALYESITK